MLTIRVPAIAGNDTSDEGAVTVAVFRVVIASVEVDILQVAPANVLVLAEAAIHNSHCDPLALQEGRRLVPHLRGPYGEVVGVGQVADVHCLFG